jgi:hypothetical protein
MIKNFIIVLVILLIIYLIYKIIHTSNYDAFGVFNNDTYFMSRPNCPQLNDNNLCKSTPGCRVGVNGCQNNLSKLRKYEKPIPEWMVNNFMIVY